MTRRLTARAAGAVLLAAAALATPAAAAPQASVTRFAFDDCTAAEAAVPVPRERAAAAVPEPFVPTGVGVPSGETPTADAFVRLVRCHDEDGNAVRTLWLGIVVRQAHPQDGLQSHVLWRVATDHPEQYALLLGALPKPLVALVPSGHFALRFDGFGGVPEEVFTTLDSSVSGTDDDLTLDWIAPSPPPPLHFPELRGLRFTWYAPTGGSLRRVVTIVPQHGGGDLGDPLTIEDPLLSLRMGPAKGVLTTPRGTWLAELLGPEGGPLGPEPAEGDRVAAPKTSRFLHVRYHRGEQCVEVVSKLDPQVPSAC